MGTAIVIPARLASQRLPDKPLQNLGGKPLIVRTLEQAAKCKQADEVLVATDSHEIIEAVQAHGGKALLTKSTHASGTDRVGELIAKLKYDFVINLQGDEPFIDPLDLGALFETLQTSNQDMATLCAPIISKKEWENPNVVKVVCGKANQALYFSRAPIPYEREETEDLAQLFRHIGVYAFQRQALELFCRTPAHFLEKRERLEQLRALALGLSIVVIPARTVDHSIDTVEDLRLAQARVEKFNDSAFPG